MLWTYPEDLSNPTASNALQAAELASSILYAYSGRKYAGLKTVTEIYSCEDKYEYTVESRLRRRVQHVTFTGTGINKLRLAGTPVVEVLRVVLNGVELDISQYSVINRNVLEFRNCEFYSCFDLTVVYTYGVDPPEAGREAARILANQFLDLRSAEECGTGRNVRTVTRQGLSYEEVDVSTMASGQNASSAGRTGIYEVDLWLASVNPSRSMKRSRSFSPDTIRPIRRTV